MQRKHHHHHRHRRMDCGCDGITQLFRQLVDLLCRFLQVSATAIHIEQENSKMAIQGVIVGKSGNFTAVANGALQAGSVPVWSSTDTNVSFAPSGDGLSAVVSLAASETAASFPITVSGVGSDGAAISTTVTVPVLAAPATGFDIEQA